MKNKVPYNIFHKWYKDTRKKVVEVQINGAPEIGREVLIDFWVMQNIEEYYV